MSKEDFIKTIAVNLLESDTYSIISHDKEFKLGIIYETKRMFVVPYYEMHDDSCILRITKYNHKFEEISSKSFESEDSAGLYMSLIPKLKESELNIELARLFTKMSIFINKKESRILN